MTSADSKNVNSFKLLNKKDILLSVIQTILVFLVSLFSKMLTSHNEQISLIYFILSTVFWCFLSIIFIIWGIYKIKQFRIWKSFSDEFKKTQNILFITLIISTFSGFICPIIIYYILTQLPNEHLDDSIEKNNDESNSDNLIAQ